MSDRNYDFNDVYNFVDESISSPEGAYRAPKGLPESKIVVFNKMCHEIYRF